LGQLRLFGFVGCVAVPQPRLFHWPSFIAFFLLFVRHSFPDLPACVLLRFLSPQFTGLVFDKTTPSGPSFCPLMKAFFAVLFWRVRFFFCLSFLRAA